MGMRVYGFMWGGGSGPVVGLFCIGLGCGLWVLEVCTFPFYKSLETSQIYSFPYILLVLI